MSSRPCSVPSHPTTTLRRRRLDLISNTDNSKTTASTGTTTTNKPREESSSALAADKKKKKKTLTSKIASFMSHLVPTMDKKRHKRQRKKQQEGGEGTESSSLDNHETIPVGKKNYHDYNDDDGEEVEVEMDRERYLIMVRDSDDDADNNGGKRMSDTKIKTREETEEAGKEDCNSISSSMSSKMRKGQEGDVRQCESERQQQQQQRGRNRRRIRLLRRGAGTRGSSSIVVGTNVVEHVVQKKMKEKTKTKKKKAPSTGRHERREEEGKVDEAMTTNSLSNQSTSGAESKKEKPSFSFDKGPPLFLFSVNNGNIIRTLSSSSSSSSPSIDRYLVPGDDQSGGGGEKLIKTTTTRSSSPSLLSEPIVLPVTLDGRLYQEQDDDDVEEDWARDWVSQCKGVDPSRTPATPSTPPTTPPTPSPTTDIPRVITAAVTPQATPATTITTSTKKEDNAPPALVEYDNSFLLNSMRRNVRMVDPDEASEASCVVLLNYWKFMEVDARCGACLREEDNDDDDGVGTDMGDDSLYEEGGDWEMDSVCKSSTDYYDDDSSGCSDSFDSRDGEGRDDFDERIVSNARQVLENSDGYTNDKRAGLRGGRCRDKVTDDDDDYDDGSRRKSGQVARRVPPSLSLSASASTLLSTFENDKRTTRSSHDGGLMSQFQSMMNFDVVRDTICAVPPRLENEV